MVTTLTTLRDMFEEFSAYEDELNFNDEEVTDEEIQYAEHKTLAKVYNPVHNSIQYRVHVYSPYSGFRAIVIYHNKLCTAISGVTSSTGPWQPERSCPPSGRWRKKQKPAPSQWNMPMPYYVMRAISKPESEADIL